MPNVFSLSWKRCTGVSKCFGWRQIMCRRRFHNVVLWRNHMTYKTNHREVRDRVLCFHFTAGLFSLSYCTTCCPHHEPRLLTLFPKWPPPTRQKLQLRYIILSVTCVFSHSVVSSSLWSHGLQSTRLLCPWDSPGKNTGVGCHVEPECLSLNPSPVTC